MKKIIKNSLTRAVALAALTMAGACTKDFETINVDPINPTETTDEYLFNSMLSSMQLGWDEQLFLFNDVFYPASQLAPVTAEPENEITLVASRGRENAWNDYYNFLKNAKLLESRLSASDVADPDIFQNELAMVKIVIAYETLRMTDMFGSIPFSEAGLGFSKENQIIRPKYDSQEAIYRKLLEDLQWAAGALVTEDGATTPAGNGYASFGEYDTFLKGDLLHWKKFANSLLLRHAFRIEGRDAALAEEIVSDILNNGKPLIGEGEDAGLWPEQLAWETDSHYWSFRESGRLRLGTVLWNMMADGNAADGSGIFDPRMRVFFETNNQGDWRTLPMSFGADRAGLDVSGNPYWNSREDAANYQADKASQSAFHFELIRDRLYMPELMITAAEVAFLKAEAFIKGYASGNAQQAYEDGVRLSVEFWTELAHNSPYWTHAKPALPTGAQLQAMMNNPKVKWNPANGLELIYAQRWINYLRQPLQAWCLSRQTGLTPAQDDVEGLTYAVTRVPYPAGESNYNAENYNAEVERLGGEDSPYLKVWWDIN